MTERFDIKALSRETGVGVRTIRYYTGEKLLPPPEGRGTAATYGPGHRDRLLLIRRLQEAHQPLAAIRERLEALDDAGVARVLAEPGGPQGTAATAADYVQRVLAGSASAPARAAPAQGDAASGKSPPARSTWERISLHSDIELHVRRPLARSEQRRLEALLESARRLFSAEGS